MAEVNKDRSLPIPKTRGIVKWRDVIPLFNVIAKMLNIELTADNMDIVETIKGFNINATPAIGDHPFKLYRRGTSGSDVLYAIRTGTINGVTPEFDSVPIYNGAEILVPQVGTKYLYFKVLFTANTNTSGTIVTGGTIDAVDLELSDTVKTSDLVNGIDYLLQAVFVDGGFNGENHRDSLAVSICDDGSGDGTAILIYGQA